MKLLNNLVSIFNSKDFVKKWDTKNLDVAYFRNGDAIPEVLYNEEWDLAGEEQKPAWCYFANSSTNGEKYGKLYNWYAVNDKRGLAPRGWHIPTSTEWNNYIKYFCATRYGNYSKKLRSAVGWSKPGSNESGFSGLPGGMRCDMFFAFPDSGFWWSSTEQADKKSVACAYVMDDMTIGLIKYVKYMGLSVRCVKD